MSEVSAQASTQESQTINMKRNLDINFWCDELNLRAEELKEIVKLVGPAVHDIRVYMAKRLMLHWPTHSIG